MPDFTRDHLNNIPPNTTSSTTSCSTNSPLHVEVNFNDYNRT